MTGIVALLLLSRAFSAFYSCGDYPFTRALPFASISRAFSAINFLLLLIFHHPPQITTVCVEFFSVIPRELFHKAIYVFI